tara:strand:- start:10635 stop:11393 length:759 start_codon:yes stop_codon:yes gene_type:complete
MTKESKNNVKGIILAGGLGTRLHPLTSVVSKHLLPIYDKPMIFYPLTILVDAGIKDIMIITNKGDKDNFKKLLGSGMDWGINITYKIQDKPEGIAQALVLSDDWAKDSTIALILGDNLFFGPKLNSLIKNGIKNNTGATIFCIESNNPERFGVIDFDQNFNPISIEEKPKIPKTNWIVTGLYIYNNKAADYARSLRKSKRGEYEITDLNIKYLNNSELKTIKLESNFSWLDTGTFDSLLEASNYVQKSNHKK